MIYKLFHLIILHLYRCRILIEVCAKAVHNLQTTITRVLSPASEESGQRDGPVSSLAFHS